MEAYFDFSDGEFVPSPWVAGPWNPEVQHGGAPAGLLAAALEQVPTLAPMRLARMTIELLRPAPLAPLSLRTKLVKDGRKVQVCDLELVTGGTVVARASALRIRNGDPSQSPAAVATPLDLPGPETLPPQIVSEHFGSRFIESVDMRMARGSIEEPEPAAIWYRLSRPMLAGRLLTGDIRAAVAGDFVNGTAAVLDPTVWSFLNCDITLNLARTPVGEWILVNSQNLIGPQGVGLATARLGDVEGYFGHAALSLIIDPRKELNR